MKERVFFEDFESFYYYHGSSKNWAMKDFHFHDQYEVILFLCDGATLEVGSRVYKVKKGDLFMINDKEYHRVNIEPGVMHTRYVIMFDPKPLSDMGKAFQYDFFMFFENRPDDFEHKLHLTPDNLEKIEKLMQKIEGNLSTEVNAVSHVILQLSLLELIAQLNEMYLFFRNEKNANDNGDNEQEVKADGELEFESPILYRERIESIKKYIREHTDEKLELDSIAKEFYLNRYYLSHYFKKETGFTVAQYIANQKVLSAKTMLKQGLTVSEVSRRLSYNSDSHFISIFKKYCGITPKQYAKSKAGNS